MFKEKIDTQRCGFIDEYHIEASPGNGIDELALRTVGLKRELAPDIMNQPAVHGHRILLYLTSEPNFIQRPNTSVAQGQID